MSFASPGRKPDMVQSILEESITGRPHDPSVPDILQPQPRSIFIKIVFWFKAQSARAMDVRIVVEKSDNDNDGHCVISSKGGAIEAHVMRRKSMSPKEEAELKIWARSQIANWSKTYPLTRRDKVLLWLLMLGTVGGVIVLLVWNHLLTSAGVVR